MTLIAPIEHWPPRLERVLAERCTLLKRITVLRETDSTQDAARRMHAQAGDVLTAWRQTRGRGRLGRAWVDTHDHGAAITCVIDRMAAEHVAIASAVGVAHAVESILCRPVGIKWPNDVLLDGCKLAGILIEQVDRIALIGIGVNVAQTSWPDELKDHAVSLRQLGAEVDRLAVLEALLPALDHALRAGNEELNRAFAARDLLRGTRATLRCGQRVFTGTIERIDPMRGLALRGDDGAEHWLPAATTSVLSHEVRPAVLDPSS